MWAAVYIQPDRLEGWCCFSKESSFVRIHIEGIILCCIMCAWMDTDSERVERSEEFKTNVLSILEGGGFESRIDAMVLKIS